MLTHLLSYILNLKIAKKMWIKIECLVNYFLGGAFGAFGNIAGNFGKSIKFGNGDLQTEAEAGASIFTGIVQAVADSMNSKDNKNNKDDKK